MGLVIQKIRFSKSRNGTQFPTMKIQPVSDAPKPNYVLHECG